MDPESLESTNRLLRVIIGVLVRAGDRQPALKEQIEMLSDLGLRPVEIAQILGKTSSHINKELSGVRKQRKREKRNG